MSPSSRRWSTRPKGITGRPAQAANWGHSELEDADLSEPKHHQPRTPSIQERPRAKPSHNPRVDQAATLAPNAGLEAVIPNPSRRLVSSVGGASRDDPFMGLTRDLSNLFKVAVVVQHG